MINGEHLIQSACVRWAQYNERNIPALKWLYAVPSGGHRHVAVAVKLKAEGVRRGISDLCLPFPAHGMHGLYLEVKTEKGRLTPEQAEFGAYLVANGYGFKVVRSCQDFVDAILGYINGTIA
jgi:hypothetical protein